MPTTIEEWLTELQNILSIKGRNVNPSYLIHTLEQIKDSEATFQTIAADTGSATASSSTDTFTISGGDNVSTSITSNTLTISIGYFMEYKGTHDASTAAYPTSPEKGDVWITSVAGTISGTYYAIGDWMVYNGTSWDKIEASGVVSDTAFGISWNAVTTIAPSKNAVYDYVSVISLSNMPTAATGNIDCGGQAITNVGNVDGIDVSAIALDNIPTAASGDIDANSQKIINLDTPTANSDAATKNYVDTTVAGASASGLYYAATAAELTTAIATITAASPAGGRIVITESLTNVQVTINAANCSFIIEGLGDAVVLDANGDNVMFTIGNCKTCIIRNLKIDVTDFTTATKRVIHTQGTGDIIIDNVTITGDGTNGIGVYNVNASISVINCNIDSINTGVWLNAPSAITGSFVSNCIIHDCINYGIYIGNGEDRIENNVIYSNAYGVYCSGSAATNIIGNKIWSNSTDGIYVSSGLEVLIDSNQLFTNSNAGIYLTGASGILLNNNYCYGNTLYGIYLSGTSTSIINGNKCNSNNTNSASNGAGIWIDANSDNNNVNGNICRANANIGVGTGYGIIINNANCDENTVMANTCLSNDTNYTNNGTNTFDTDGAAQALNNVA